MPRALRSTSVRAGLALERGDLLRDGRLRERERLGGGGERAARGDLPQDAHAADIEHQRSLYRPREASFELMGMGRHIGCHPPRCTLVHNPLSPSPRPPPAPTAGRARDGRSGPGSGSSTWSGARPISRSAWWSRPCRRSCRPAGVSSLAGAAMLAFLAWRRGLAVLRPPRRQLLSSLAVGVLLMGANAVVSVAEVDVPSSMAALLIGSVPLWVILYRRLLGDRVAGGQRRPRCCRVRRRGAAAAARQADRRRPAAGAADVVGAAAMWAGGSVASTRLTLPRDPFVSGGWQMLLGGGVCRADRRAGRRVGRLPPRRISAPARSSRFAYLVVFGSWLAFTAYAWLLQNAPVSRVATYAYVNPVVAIALGWAILDEAVTRDDVRRRRGDRRLGRGGGAHRGTRARTLVDFDVRGHLRA